MDSLPSDPASLLDELNRLHHLLSDNQPHCQIPVLDQIIEEPSATATPAELESLLQQSAQQLIGKVIQDFMPQISAELERRLHTHLQQLVHQQQIATPATSQSDSPFDFLP